SLVPPPEYDGPRLDGLRLLLAEDNDINQQIATELLHSAGAMVDLADNGRQALDMLHAATPTHYHAVLLDLQMPVMGGLEAAQHIHADARYQGLPVIAMTAHALQEERERCLAAGMVDHITKPLDPLGLLQCVQRWARTAHPHSAPPLAPATTPGHRLAPQPGLDLEAGLRRVAGNEALYLRLLGQFTDTHAQAATRAQVALNQGDADGARRILHTIRGVAGNIGLAELADAAQAVEERLQRHAPASAAVDVAMEQLQLQNRRAVSALRALLEAATPDAADEPPAPPDPVAQARGRHLAQLLAHSDGDCVEYLQAHAASLRSLFPPGGFSAMHNAIQRFDFEVAHGLLTDALAQAALP
ncbi:MAG: response regulator, partial [Burkholderiales bacterium]|nr:response regulator [Burkholderiales bacterium]